MENEVPGESVFGGEDPLTVWTVELCHPLVDRVYVGLTMKNYLMEENPKISAS